MDLFNFATLPFYWGRLEPVRGEPDTRRLLTAARWFADRGCAVKGHPLAWHTSTAEWLLDLATPDIARVQVDRIRREVTDFAGLIDMWDVINEVVIMPIFDKYDNGITRVCRDIGRIPMVRMVFDATREATLVRPCCSTTSTCPRPMSASSRACWRRASRSTARTAEPHAPGLLG